LYGTHGRVLLELYESQAGTVWTKGKIRVFKQAVHIQQRTMKNHRRETVEGFKVISQNCEKRLIASSCLSLCVEQLGFHWTNFYKISFLRVSPKAVDKTHVSLKSDKNNGYFT